MAITTLDQYIASNKQIVQYTKTAAVTSVALNWYSVHQAAGNPGAGVLAAATSVTTAVASAGIVPDDTLAGYPVINTTGTDYYLSKVEFANTVLSRLMIYDRLWHVNMVLTTLGTGTITAPGSYAARLPSTNYNLTAIIVEITTTVSATATTVAVTYTNQAGTTGRSTGATASLSGFVAGRWLILPLQAGDTGVQKIESIVVGGTVATTGAVNVAVVRPLWYGRVSIANFGDTHGFDRTGMPIIYNNSALGLAINADSTSTGLPDLQLEIASI
jgi:hypothetical protein